MTYIVVTIFIVVSQIESQSLSLATTILSDHSSCQNKHRISSSYRVNSTDTLQEIKDIFPKAYNIDLQVTGFARTKASSAQAYVLDQNGSMVLVPHASSNKMQSVGLGINIFGWIVGQVKKGDQEPKAFVFVKEMEELIDIHPKKSSTSKAVAINGLGEIVIQADNESYLRKKDGTLILLEGLGGRTQARAINDDGIVCLLYTSPSPRD